jgi:hypothetical protein
MLLEQLQQFVGLFFFGFAKSNLPNTYYFSTCHIILGLGKQQELSNQKCKTVAYTTYVQVPIPYTHLNIERLALGRKKLGFGTSSIEIDPNNRTGKHRSIFGKSCFRQRTIWNELARSKSTPLIEQGKHRSVPFFWLIFLLVPTVPSN